MTNTRTSRALTVTIAAAAALLLWAVNSPLPGHDLLVDQGGTVQRIGPLAVLAAAALAGLAAWVLLALLERAGRRGSYRYVASVVLLLSLAGPLTSAVDRDTALALLGMHVTVGTALIIGLPGLRSHAVGCRAVRTGTAR
ncbi:DUF6069 family protein [Actinoplanes derwentensis]|uniref:Uncharacterized protein n=1 Tax=Actinoplanes derwentensis TaxID=113562 RepID=A0A1H1TBJ6_9ACTN|nr:DUF6069 family protein [Actinoplanes derwentensis]GID89482.1 hypothetical protein Ade03nite_84060 [Actinoplanes derwentensis]SDS57685.1 hypothetical protein SAMN04489716_1095 [Actinoplanes derwentensis]